MTAPRWRRRTAAILFALIGLAGSAAVGADMATASGTQPQPCPPAQQAATCLQGRVIMWNPASDDPGATEVMVEDGYGAPMAWVNLYGLYSGGDGGKDPGGLVCVTYRVQASVACLTPRGDLTLTPTGPNGPTGPPQVLTPADIALLNAMRRAGLTVRDLRVLAALAHAREARR